MIKSIGVGTAVVWLWVGAFANQRQVAIADGSEMSNDVSTEAVELIVDDLSTAHYGEANSHRRYLGFAATADAEGYGQVASMFRAIARGEEIHAERIASLLKSLGMEPQSASEPVISLSTRENLESSVEEQKYEKDVMYPPFVERAQEAKHESVKQVYSRNMASEPTHMAWFQQALSDLDGYKGANIDFLVCPGCGYTVRTLPEASCPVCATEKNKFEKIR